MKLAMFFFFFRVPRIRICVKRTGVRRLANYNLISMCYKRFVSQLFNEVKLAQQAVIKPK